ncbi:hypothetical protein [Nocardioides sp.]|uniref:hypothetical protein n=1 Tax=Nocardioides sp. TaxID=35761 RepID=UPI002ED67E2A
MTTTVTPPVTTGGPTRRTASRSWAFAGVGAGVAGIASVVASGFTGAVYDEKIAGDAVAITDRLAELTTQILVFHVATMVSALLLVVFAVGLRRRLAAALPADSLLPGVASAGLMLVAAAQLLGSGLTTEFVFGVQDPDLMVPETAAFFSHWIGTIPWLWGTAGLTALAVAVAARRFGAVPRWLGVTSLLMGGLMTLLAVSPLQYMAGMVGPLWLTIAAIGLAAGRTR